MIDSFDYKEPACALCGGKEFYNPNANAPIDFIPVKRIIEKLDGFFASNKLKEAGELLEFWQKEAVSLNDKKGELSITDELIGYYRKTGEKEKGLNAVERSLNLIKELHLEGTVSAGTIILNAATTQKAFGQSEKAIFLYDKAFKAYETLNPTDERFAGFYNNKALALTDLKRFDEAEECYQNALAVLKQNPPSADVAVTYVNMAHLYEEWQKEKSVITDCLFKAYECLNNESLEKNGYYAFVIKKCAPSFNHFGYQKIASELNETSEVIYERNRNQP